MAKRERGERASPQPEPGQAERGLPQEPAGAPGAEEAQGGPEVMEQRLAQAREEARQYLDNWRRAAADFANYRRRQDTERAELAQQARAELITRLLPVLDDLQRALDKLPHSLRHLTWVEGILLIERKLRAVLAAEGVQPMEAVGKEFDPHYHEAILYEPSEEAPEGRVIAELQTGYVMDERVLRPALVTVSRGPAESAHKDGQEESKEE